MIALEIREPEAHLADGDRHSFGCERNNRVPDIRTKAHQVRPKLHRHTKIDDTGRTEDQNVVAVDGKRPPGLNLARARFSDLGIIDVIRAAKLRRNGRWC